MLKFVTPGGGFGFVTLTEVVLSVNDKQPNSGDTVKSPPT